MVKHYCVQFATSTLVCNHLSVIMLIRSSTGRPNSHTQTHTHVLFLNRCLISSYHLHMNVHYYFVKVAVYEHANCQLTKLRRLLLLSNARFTFPFIAIIYKYSSGNVLTGLMVPFLATWAVQQLKLLCSIHPMFEISSDIRTMFSLL